MQYKCSTKGNSVDTQPMQRDLTFEEASCVYSSFRLARLCQIVLNAGSSLHLLLLPTYPVTSSAQYTLGECGHIQT